METTKYELKMVMKDGREYSTVVDEDTLYAYAVAYAEYIGTTPPSRTSGLVQGYALKYYCTKTATPSITRLT